MGEAGRVGGEVMKEGGKGSVDLEMGLGDRRLGGGWSSNMSTRPRLGVPLPIPPPGVRTAAVDFVFAGLGEWWRKISMPAADSSVSSPICGGGGVPVARSRTGAPGVLGVGWLPSAVELPSVVDPSDPSLPWVASMDANALAADSSSPATSAVSPPPPSLLAPGFRRRGRSGGGNEPYERERAFFLSGELAGEKCPPDGSRRFRSGDKFAFARRAFCKLTTAESVDETVRRWPRGLSPAAPARDDEPTDGIRSLPNPRCDGYRGPDGLAIGGCRGGGPIAAVVRADDIFGLAANPGEPAWLWANENGPPVPFARDAYVAEGDRPNAPLGEPARWRGAFAPDATRRKGEYGGSSDPCEGGNSPDEADGKSESKFLAVSSLADEDGVRGRCG